MKVSYLNSIRRSSGFSLIELMIVVAIIGILASIAVPNFITYRNNVHNAQARSNLSGFFTATKIFFGEWNQYFGDWRNLGFSIDGDMYFRVGFAMGTGGTSPRSPAGYTGPGAPSGTQAFQTNSNPMALNCGPPPLPCEENVDTVCSLDGSVHKWETTTFVAASCAFLKRSDGTIFRQNWSINEKKTIRNTLVP